MVIHIQYTVIWFLRMLMSERKNSMKEIYETPEMEIVEFDTEDGYFAANRSIEIIDLQQTKVLIKIPFGIENITISTKQQGNIIKEEYKVVIA